MTDKARNKIIYKFAYSYLKQHLPEGISEAELKKYLSVDKKKTKDLKDVFMIFIHSAQNYQRMPNTIKFDERREEFKDILAGYDHTKVAKMDIDALYQTFKAKYDPKGHNGKKNSWYKFSASIVDTAVFLCKFKDLKDFRVFVKRFDYNAQTRMTLPLLISTKIRGIGFALACNALKELGYEEYPKPDVHMIDICKELGLCGDDQYDVFEALVSIAEDNEVTPYEVDKVLWLICSGNYYMHGIKVKPLKKDFIEKCKEKLGKSI